MCVGRLADEDTRRLNQAILVFLGPALLPRTKHLIRRCQAPGFIPNRRAALDEDEHYVYAIAL
jgi:hypothetical protein